MGSSVWLPVADKQDSTTLRHFGLGMSLMILLVFALLLPWLMSAERPVWPLPVATGLLIFAVCLPRLLYYPYRAWMVIASLLNAVNTRLIMFIAYFGMIVPIGLVLRLMGKTPYARRPDARLESYWKARTSSPQPNNLKEPF
ncbi:SxtJ family membrane protein [Alteromonas halophila]|uniref:SxtJ n=1 Tax=Alteromonas halophila TaxID=516698 RepID=A0A918MYZ4_9ALTE|nr:SxtJ family membrane protein [Alteromonas halophila]GGW88127.1 hypothetical protein GCM10007391_22380 [Alteromonas halophila]